MRQVMPAGRSFPVAGFTWQAALRNGLTPEQIQEVLLQVAVYAGVPVANRAFPIAQRAIAEAQEAEGAP